MNILGNIASYKRLEVKKRKVTNPVTLLEKSAFYGRKAPSFFTALAKPLPSLIGEFKRRSPSKGLINSSADIRQVAAGYQEAGIAAMSVLTDEKYFGGKNDDLREVAGSLTIPLLRKDFIVDEYQVVEAKSIGAGAILLIAAILTKQEVRIFSGLAGDLGLDVLFEIHDRKDLEKLNQNIRIIGVNNRNLQTFETSLDNSAALLRYLPRDCLKVAESGFHTPGEVNNLFSAGYDAFLIGEYFMRSVNPGLAASEFINELNKIH
jgi:indole-3-glycerol phosphate synthase